MYTNTGTIAVASHDNVQKSFPDFARLKVVGGRVFVGNRMQRGCCIRQGGGNSNQNPRGATAITMKELLN